MTTLAQDRAKFALDKVMTLNEKEKHQFESLAAGAPSMILQNGLGQALAFWYTKKEDKCHALTCIIREWLVKRFTNKLSGITSDDTLVKKMCELEQNDFLTLQQETMALLEWVKRYAKAFIK